MLKINIAMVAFALAFALAPAAQAHEARIGSGSSFVTIYVPQSSDAGEQAGSSRTGSNPIYGGGRNQHP
jgi:hypothetical protein